MTMPKIVKELTAAAVERLKPDAECNRRVMVGPSDCAGLHLRLEGGSKSWTLRIKVGDKRRDIGLRSYSGKTGLTLGQAALVDGLSLEEARAKARELRRIARETGAVTSPTVVTKSVAAAEARDRSLREAKLKTFHQCAELCIADKSSEWKNVKHAKQWAATLETYAYPIIGGLPIAEIDRGLVLDVLRPIWTSKNETASRLRGELRR
jgi:hypothetical protein